MKKVGVIGGGIVGASAAYFLNQNEVSIVVFDEGSGQATKAAVGIICPWVNQRRNQAWYRLVSEGAKMYDQREELFPNQSFYNQTGTLITHEKQLDKLYRLALKRFEDHSEMKEVRLIDCVNQEFPVYQQSDSAIYVAGGGVVDGQKMVNYLLSDVEVISEKVERIFRQEDGFIINGNYFDQIILAVGPHLPKLLNEYRVDVSPQKGQLMVYRHVVPKGVYPVLMPTGYGDVMIDLDGNVTVGATHENDQGFSTEVDVSALDSLQELANKSMIELRNREYDEVKVGIRAYTSDFLPFFGRIEPGIYAASGLGSSGLTSGPYIGQSLARLVLGQVEESEFEAYSPLKYLIKG